MILMFDWMNRSCSFSLFGIFITGKELFRKISVFKELSVFSFLKYFNRFSVTSLVSLEDSYNPLITGESFSEIMKFVMFITRINISNIIPTFRFTHRGLNIPSSIIRKFVHQTVLHGWKDLIVDSVSIPSHVIFLLNVWIYATTDSNHP